HGLVDGALAARETVESWGGELAEDHAEGSETDEIDQTENGKPSEPKTRRRSGTRRRTSHRSARPSHTKGAIFETIPAFFIRGLPEPESRSTGVQSPSSPVRLRAPRVVVGLTRAVR